MDEKPPRHPGDHKEVEPALGPLGVPPESPVAPHDPDMIHIAPEMAIAEADVWPAEKGEYVRGSSLWRDAWRRLLKNKLAVFGLVVVSIVAIASVIGPWIIQATLGITPDYIPRTSAKR